MKRIKILIILCILIVTVKINAQQQVSRTEAKNAAINTLYNKTEVLNRSADTEIDTVHSFSNSRSDVLMYEVVFKNRAAILLSGSKACLPVLGYYIKPDNDNGAIFDTTNINVPCCLRAFIYDYIQQLELSFEQRNVELTYENEWNELQQSNLQRNLPPANILVPPLTKSKWDQLASNDGYCDAYNYFVTETGSDCPCKSKRCNAGCVAVAMAQVMYYWKYPVYMSGTTQQYDWCNMSDCLYYTLNPNYVKERNAIARLIRDCGTSIGTKYCYNNECSASAFSIDVKTALTNKYGYNADYQLRSNFTETNWKNKIKTNLNNNRPVYYSARCTTNNAGHAFVCDGYGSDDLFHFNWGWGTNTYETWFTVNNITLSIYNFTSNQAAIFDIYPNTNQDYCNYTYSLVTHFQSGGTNQNIPKFTTLNSVPESYNSAWRSIESGQTVEYVAHEEIRILPGFHAKAGSNFVARIEPCVSCNSAKITQKSSVNGEEIEEELYIAVGDDEEKQSLPEEPQIYPNPTTGLLTINAKNDNSHIEIIEIYNTQGVKQFTFNGNNRFFQEIDISHLPSQVYSLKIQINGEVFTKKLILQK